MRRLAILIAAVLLAVPAFADNLAAWQGFGGDAQHRAQAPAAAQAFTRIHWRAALDLAPQLSGGELLIHYGSPMITTGNTLFLPVKTGAAGGFRIDVHDGATGQIKSRLYTDYVLPPHDWTPSFSPVLTPQGRLYMPRAGGLIHYRDTPDQPTGAVGDFAFYGIGQYNANAAAYQAAIMINTPLTTDTGGNIFFGFLATGSTPLGLKSGIARVGADGKGTWISAGDAAQDQTMTKIMMNCAPAVSNDGTTIYIAVSNGSIGYLVGLDAATLAPKYRVRLLDPQSGFDAYLSDDSSASPTIGPDGDVFYGVLENPFPNHDDRGWLLHFDATLATIKIPGSFGWDNTVSILPASAVPSFTGGSTYLLLSKYNNYFGAGPYGDGHNKVAILDPNASQTDPDGTAKVMKEVTTILGGTQFPGAPQGVTYEWCINSAVVDPIGRSAYVNSEDGHIYRWDLATKARIKGTTLNSPRPEAYTSTLIGPDGTIYAMNNSTLYAIGQ